MSKIIEMLRLHEGEELKPYECTAGKSTIGVGRNIEDNGISAEESEFLLKNDLVSVNADIKRNFPWFDGLSEARKDVIMDMVFNLGVTRFKGFKKFIAAMSLGNYETASKEMLDSRWARQVGARSERLSVMIKTDEYPKMWR